MPPHEVELRADDRRLAPHEGPDAARVPQEADVAELVHLVGTDGLDAQVLREGGEVGGDAARKATPAPARVILEVDAKSTTLSSVPAARQRSIRFASTGGSVVEVVHRVGVVPQDPEVGPARRPSCAKPLDDLVRVDVPGRVRVLRDAPDALDARVFGHERLDAVHVGTAVADPHVDELEAEALRDPEVPVVTRHHAEEPEGAGLPPPGGLRTERPVQPGVQHVLVHQREAGVPARDHLVRAHAEQVGPQAPRFRDAGQPPVVAGVGAVIEAVVAAERVVEPVGQGHLLRTGLPAGQVQRQPRVLQRLEPSRQLALSRGKRTSRVKPSNMNADYSGGGRCDAVSSGRGTAAW